MFKRPLFAASFVGIVLGIGFAQQSNLTIPAGKTSANDGKQMFGSYCAPCHGMDGRGHGPVAGALIEKPSDLTLLSKINRGNYPAVHVISVLQAGSRVEAHGTKDMPVWGPILGTLDHSSENRSLQTLRVSNLADYIQSLQAK
jgi:mono/diheme cytochrome c family protein